MIELWRPIRGYEGLYEVSDKGQVRSLTTRGRGVLSLRKAPKILKPDFNQNGYPRIALSKDRLIRKHFIHRLVLEAFVGPKPHRLEACHFNGVRDDNRSDNLGWVTRKENCSHREKHGTNGYGESNSYSKLTNEQAVEVYERAHNGKEPLSSIAEKYSITHSTVSYIKSGKTWAKIIREHMEEK